MATTSYRINFRGHSWWTTDVDVVQEHKQKGATITATTMNDTDIPGVPMYDLSDAQLQELERIAQSEQWDHVTHMTRNWRQKQIDQ